VDVVASDLDAGSNKVMRQIVTRWTKKSFLNSRLSTLSHSEVTGLQRKCDKAEKTDRRLESVEKEFFGKYLTLFYSACSQRR
jgi:hypothetical protein